MTDVVVTESGKTVVIDKTTTTVVTSGMIPPISANSIMNSVDVDVTQLQDGGVLVYNIATHKWTATNLFEKQIFEAGQF